MLAERREQQHASAQRGEGGGGMGAADALGAIVGIGLSPGVASAPGDILAATDAMAAAASSANAELGSRTSTLALGAADAAAAGAAEVAPPQVELDIGELPLATSPLAPPERERTYSASL